MSKRSQFRAFAREHIKSENAQHSRDSFNEIPPYQWPASSAREKKRFKVLRSREFLAQLFNEPNGVIRISVTKSQKTIALYSYLRSKQQQQIVQIYCIVDR